MQDLNLVLVGNPNCGKTTLFNKLTGSSQRVGNWAGVTVKEKKGYFQSQGNCCWVNDLPGCYTLVTAACMALDEKTTCEQLLRQRYDLIINVIDACNLQRDLYLTHQLRELNRPMIVVINRFDIAIKQGIRIEEQQLAEWLGCPVIPVVAKTGQGLSQLRTTIFNMGKEPIKPFKLEYPKLFENYLLLWRNVFAKHSQQFDADALAIRALEGDNLLRQWLIENDHQHNFECNLDALKEQHGQLDVLLASWRHRNVERWCQSISTKRHTQASKTTDNLDKIFLNRYFGIPAFFVVMYLMFFFALNIGGALQPFFELTSQAIFIDGPRQLLTSWQASPLLTNLICHGIGKGINITFTFIPVLAAMFFFLSFLEGSGYLARAAFVMDKFMRYLGLPGKSFVPMIIGFGCNVPAVMGCRTLENRHERILTIMMTPFMSCSARLAIYAVFVSAFFGDAGQNIIFGLYMIGIAIAVMTGLILKGILFDGSESSLLLELPAYQKPALNGLVRQTWFRLKQFVNKAGSLIIPLCMVISLVGFMNPNHKTNQLEESGRAISVIFKPIGIEQDNWPATVGLLSGVVAKEVVVGTLNALYSQVEQEIEQPTIKETLIEAVQSIPEQFGNLHRAFANPLANAPDEDIAVGAMGSMVEHFRSQAAAFAYLLFVLLYFPCISVVASITKELNWRWGVFSVVWTTGLAYLAALLFYQTATFLAHPKQSIMFITTSLTMFILTIVGIRKVTQRMKAQYSVKTIPTPIMLG